MTALATSAPVASRSPTAGGEGQLSALAGFGSLVRLLLRRDRVRMALWFGGIVGLVLITAVSITGLYNTPAELEQYARLARGSTALVVQVGPGYGLDDPTTAAVMMNEVGVWTILLVGLMSIFLVVRHTRGEEESERAEMIRAAPAGRHAQLAAALVGVTMTNVAVAAGVVATLLAYDLPLAGTLAFGLVLVGAGSVFAGIAAVTAQIATVARSALALGGAALGISFVLRAVGDVGDGRLTWLSPVGWAQAIRAYADERWWVLALPIVATAVLVYVAVQLQNRRDFGAGLVAHRPGRAVAAPGLATPLALAVQLQRASVVGWTVGVGLIGFFYGIVADQAEGIFDESPELADFLAQLGEGSITEAFLSMAMLIVALIAAGFTVSSVLRLRSEELAGRADPVLATPTPRYQWALSHTAVAAGGTVIIMGLSGLAVGVGFALASGDVGQILPLLASALVMVPAMLVMAGTVVLAFGLAPRWSPLVWGGFAYAVLVGFFATVLNLPQWALNISPFQHVPALPAAEFEILPILCLCAVALLLLWAGLVALARRDMT